MRLLLLLWLLVGCAAPAKPPDARSGTLDLSGYTFTRRGVSLEGALVEASGAQPFGLPWPDDGSGGEQAVVEGRLTILLPPTERPLAILAKSSCAPFRLRFLDAAGQPVREDYLAGSIQPLRRTRSQRLLTLPPVSALTLEVETHAAACRSVDPRLSIGDAAELDSAVWARRQENWLVAGVMLVTGLYHLLLYLLRRAERAPLWLGAFGIALSVRLWSLYDGPETRWADFDNNYLHNLLEYTGFYFAVPLFAAYLSELFPREVSQRLAAGLGVIMAALTLLLWFGPERYSYTSLWLAETSTIIAAPLLIGGMVLAWWRGRDPEVVGWVGTGTALLALLTIAQILSNQGYFEAPPLEHWGMASFVFCQSAVLAVLNGRARRQAEDLARELVRTNAALSRFVPTPFLRLLGKDDLTQVALGDQVEREITVLFCDIRGFTGLSEGLSAKETFEVLNACLRRVAPIVREHHGFIDKYIGDAIMALFPREPGDAVRASLAIADALAHMPGDRKITMGFGVHMGLVMLGTIGEAARMEGTVISDAVNLASRLEGLTRKLDTTLLVSEETWQRFEDSQDVPHRFVGRLRVAGKQRAVGVVEVGPLGGPASEQLNAAVAAFTAKRLDEARDAFAELVVEWPDDPVIRLFWRACERADAASFDGTLRFEK